MRRLSRSERKVWIDLKFNFYFVEIWILITVIFVVKKLKEKEKLEHDLEEKKVGDRLKEKANLVNSLFKISKNKFSK